MKTVIIGNSGSGKTWLARRLAEVMPAKIIHLDDLFWESGGFDRKRDANDVQQLVLQSKKQESWIVEGVFGELAELYFDEADCLVWLDFDWATCKERLENRGSESKQHLGREQSEGGLKRLIEWAKNYPIRTDLRSHTGHRLLFERFVKARMYLTTEDSVDAYLRDVQHCAAVGRVDAPLS